MISLNDVLLAMSNIPVDDPIAEIWGRGLQGGYKIIEYTGTLPITINANGDALIDYRIYGVSGGVGEPTESGEPAGCKLPMTVMDNLAPPLSQWVSGYVNTNGKISPPERDQKEKTSDFIEVKPNTQYTFSVEGDAFPKGNNGSWLEIGLYRDDQTFISRPSSYLNPSPFTFFTSSETKYIRLSYRTYGELWEPRLSENSFSIPVYIGENQLDSIEGVSDYVDKASGKIVRMIGEYIFTGDELFSVYGFNVCYTANAISPRAESKGDAITMQCDHPTFTAISNTALGYWANYGCADNACNFRADMSQIALRSTANFMTAKECRAFLKEQYDNGTPVKISYWLKTPIEEDPPVSFPDIPTINGETIIDYDGTPKPSQMYIKYKSKG